MRVVSANLQHGVPDPVGRPGPPSRHRTPARPGRRRLGLPGARPSARAHPLRRSGAGAERGVGRRARVGPSEARVRRAVRPTRWWCAARWWSVRSSPSRGRASVACSCSPSSWRLASAGPWGRPTSRCSRTVARRAGRRGAPPPDDAPGSVGAGRRPQPRATGCGIARRGAWLRPAGRPVDALGPPHATRRLDHVLTKGASVTASGVEKLPGERSPRRLGRPGAGLTPTSTSGRRHRGRRPRRGRGRRCRGTACPGSS